ncbi:uncharacterized protein [Ptychodera flava]|uniref:uncharacterized protein n=1 Tax=Ptychodera flava TaxID=63121 RepID=UPI00396A5604
MISPSLLYFYGVSFLLGSLHFTGVRPACTFTQPNEGRPIEQNEELPPGTSVYNITVTGDLSTEINLELAGRHKDYFKLVGKELQWAVQYDLDMNVANRGNEGLDSAL